MQDIHTNAPEGIKVQINESDVTDIQAVLEGPGWYTLNTNPFKYELHFQFRFESKSNLNLNFGQMQTFVTKHSRVF